jgi:hypothetical protein
MRIQKFSAAVGAGAVLALAAVIPGAEAKEVDASHHSTNAMSAQALSALEARWNAEAAGSKVMKARVQAAQVLKARGWYAEAKYYG